MKKESQASIQERKDVRFLLSREVLNVQANRHLTQDEKDLKVRELLELIESKYN